MATTRYPTQSKTPETFTWYGSFAPAGAGAPTAVNGYGFTVVRTSQGLFTITLDEAAMDLVSVVPGLQLAAATADRFSQVGQTDVVSAKTVQLRVVDAAGAVQDVAADANNRINFAITVARKNVTQ